MKNGFTLIEVLGVIIIMAAIALISIPIVEKQIKDSKKKLLDEQVNYIVLAAEEWISDKHKPEVGQTVTIALSYLKESGLIKNDAKNPMTNTYFANDMLIKIKNNNGVLDYSVLLDTGYDFTVFGTVWGMFLKGNEFEYVELGDAYVEPGVSTISGTFETIGSVDTTKVGIYELIYKIPSFSQVRNVIVRDTIAPNIVLSNDKTNIYVDDVSKINYTSYITATDKSSYKIEVIGTAKAVAGDYTITYVVTDSSGNVSKKNKVFTVINR